MFTTQPVGNVAEGVNFSTSPVVKVEDSEQQRGHDGHGQRDLGDQQRAGGGRAHVLEPGLPHDHGRRRSGNVHELSDHRNSGSRDLHADRRTAVGSDVHRRIDQRRHQRRGVANKLAFTSAPVAGQPATTTTLGPLTIQVQDGFGNPVTGARTVNLTSTGSPKFATTQNVSGASSLGAFDTGRFEQRDLLLRQQHCRDANDHGHLDVADDDHADDAAGDDRLRTSS